VESDRRGCYYCRHWDDSGDTLGSCGWAYKAAVPYWAEAAEPIGKRDGNQGYTHFDSGRDCATFEDRATHEIARQP
jgi:hypothetical protein